jgi:hypothetical protein
VICLSHFTYFSTRKSGGPNYYLPPLFRVQINISAWSGLDLSSIASCLAPVATELSVWIYEVRVRSNNGCMITNYTKIIPCSTNRDGKDSEFDMLSAHVNTNFHCSEFNGERQHNFNYSITASWFASWCRCSFARQQDYFNPFAFWPNKNTLPTAEVMLTRMLKLILPKIGSVGTHIRNSPI